ncbi:NADP-dependent oxidoreductase domain-containing protein [Xylaria acuta]|nr:NADP-dependent oxidoreductase domain-containing protein [Xylaria acuta]
MAHLTQPLLRQLGKDVPFITAFGFGLMGMSLGYGPSNTFGLKTSTNGITFDSSPSYCEGCIEKSLKRPKVNYVDLYYLHCPNPEVPIKEAVQAMKRFLRSERKVKCLRLSKVSSPTLRRAHAIHRISAVQLGISIFAYSPLGRGIMTGSCRYGPFSGGNLKNNLQLVDKLGELARRKDCTSGQLVLAWLLAQEENIFVIPGRRDTKSGIGANGGRDTKFGAYIDTVPLEG